ncbi:MAG: tRNA (N(6)-L-threonylcarbamoyladenosine(37)-C(2))-methylthiotransferase [archaeon GB-1867-005]|nr:tRNA (N(6)-L-threonylcarbamoyladenosine(37)-C(2))-methylthiotransferase [Candidatus Culexmicrobium cathedralense]
MRKIYVETYGCSANVADTNIMVTLLKKAGYEVVDSIDEADVVILNTCTVRGESERKMVKRLKELEKLRQRLNFKLVVAGCLAKAQPALIAKISPKASMLAPQLIEEVVEVVKDDSRIIKILGEGKRRTLPKHFEGVKFTVPIAEGCIGSCTYCIVKVARGRLRSYPPEEIVEAVECAVKAGAREIRLTAQDTAAYGLDIGTSLPELVEKITEIPGDFMIRIGMMNPDGALKMLDKLLKVYESDKVYKFIHIPLQSGDDRILKLMRRKYTSSQFIQLAREFRRRFPEGFIATDVIVGFPTEDEAAFNNTLKVISEVEPDKVHVARYSPRPHTEAAALPQIPEAVKKKRSKIMTNLSLKIGLKRNIPLVGRVEEALAVDEGYGGTIKARLNNYKIVVFNGDPSIIGEKVKVKIVEASPIQLRGKLI